MSKSIRKNILQMDSFLKYKTPPLFLSVTHSCGSRKRTFERKMHTRNITFSYLAKEWKNKPQAPSLITLAEKQPAQKHLQIYPTKSTGRYYLMKDSTFFIVPRGLPTIHPSRKDGKNGYLLKLSKNYIRWGFIQKILGVLR